MSVYTRSTEVTVCAVPEDYADHHAYRVRVQYRGEEQYAVVWEGYCLRSDGAWSVEQFEATPEWWADHRYDYQTACRLACEVAPWIVVNGRTAEEAARVVRHG